MEQQTMGARIAALRKEKGMTQLELAQQLHVTDKAVSKWERDLAAPDIHSLPALAELLGTSVDALLTAARPSAAAKSRTSQVRQIIGLILRVVPLAMGVAVTVLSILGELDMRDLGILLGIGLFSISLYLLDSSPEP